MPPLLVQRYAEELRLDVMSVALVLEQVRTLQLHALQRPSVRPPIPPPIPPAQITMIICFLFVVDLHLLM